jgi:hypothetical protein
MYITILFCNWVYVGFDEGGKTEEPSDNALEQWRKPTTNPTHNQVISFRLSSR